MGIANKVAQALARRIGYESTEAAEKAFGKTNWENKVAAEEFRAKGGETGQKAAASNMEDIPVPPPRPKQFKRQWPTLPGVGESTVQLPPRTRGPDSPVDRTSFDAELEPQVFPEGDFGALSRKVGAAAGMGTATAVVAGKSDKIAQEDDPGEEPEEQWEWEWDSAEEDTAEESPPTAPYSDILGGREKEAASAAVESISVKEPSRKGIDSAYRLWEEAVNKLDSKGADTSDIDAEIAAARAEYKQAKKTNEWKELAAMIAHGLAQFGAYAAGGSEFVVGDKLNVPKIDYSKRTDQSAREYEMMVGIAEKQRAARKQAARDEYDMQKERLRPLREKVDVEQQLYNQEATTGREDVRANRYKEAAQKREDVLQTKAAIAERRDIEKQAETERKRLDDIQKSVLRASGQKKDSLNALRGQAEAMGVEPDQIEKIENPEDTVFIREKTKKANLQSALLEMINRTRSNLSSRKPAASVAPLSEEDRQALEWANKNPTDPRAIEIRNRLNR